MADAWRSTLAESLRYLMKRERITPTDLSKRADVGRQTIYRILAAKGDVNMDTVQRLAIALMSDPIMMLSGAMPPKSAASDDDLSEMESLDAQRQRVMLALGGQSSLEVLEEIRARLESLEQWRRSLEEPPGSSVAR